MAQNVSKKCLESVPKLRAPDAPAFVVRKCSGVGSVPEYLLLGIGCQL
jgi:hypothetical protein